MEFENTFCGMLQIVFGAPVFLPTLNVSHKVESIFHLAFVISYKDMEMRSLLVSMLILSPFMAISQLYVEGRNVNEMEISYISIEKGTIIGFQSGMACYDTEEAIRGHCAPITDENGNVVKFARPVSMIEFVSKRGCMYEGNIDSDLGDGLAMLSVRKTVLREDTIPPNEKD